MIYRMSRTESKQWYENRPLHGMKLHSGDSQGRKVELFPEYTDQAYADEKAGLVPAGTGDKVLAYQRHEARRHLTNALCLDDHARHTAQDVIRARAAWRAGGKSYDIYDCVGDLVHSYVPKSEASHDD